MSLNELKDYIYWTDVLESASIQSIMKKAKKDETQYLQETLPHIMLLAEKIVRTDYEIDRNYKLGIYLFNETYIYETFIKFVGYEGTKINYITAISKPIPLKKASDPAKIQKRSNESFNQAVRT